jgi:hypothetical protein
MTFYNKKGYFNFPIVNFPFSHKFALFSFGIPTKDEELDLRHPTGFLNYTNLLTQTELYCWVPNASLSKLLTYILSAVKTGLQSYYDTH